MNDAIPDASPVRPTADQLFESALRDGNEGAFRELVEQQYPLVREAIFQRVRNTHDADELTFKVFCELFYRRQSLPATITNWIGFLRKAAINRAIDHLRHQGQLRLEAFWPGQLEAVPHSDPDPCEQLLNKETGETILHALASLPARQERAILLWSAGLTGPEAAKALEIPMGTFYSDVAKAKVALRRKLRHLA